jgi:Flp pilus assembly protein TadG
MRARRSPTGAPVGMAAAALIGMFRQFEFLAGYEDVNDADHLEHVGLTRGSTFDCKFRRSLRLGFEMDRGDVSSTLYIMPAARWLIELQSMIRERRGTVAIFFGIAAPVLLGVAGIGLDYARATMLRAHLQSAVDSAALAATTALAKGQTIQVAEAIANQTLANNTPPGVTGSASIAPTITGSTAATTVTFTGSSPTTFGQIFHVGSISLSVNSTAQSSVGTAAAAGTTYYAGNGSVAGDPHIAGADGSSGYLACGTPSGSWLNLLSDSGIQINVSCVTYTGIWADVIQSFSILLGSHVISLSSASPTFDSNGNASYDAATAWFGKITIDGVTYPPVLGQHSYLDGVVRTNITDLTNFYASDNMVNINTGVYNIFITFDAYAMGDINITATNAGLCGVPGGFWGGTLAGREDYRGSDFLVSGPTAKSYQFNWSTCPITTSHLTK